MAAGSRPALSAHGIYSAAVERPAKERLIGAAVLVAAAVILIPEMLSGPKRESHAPSKGNTTQLPAAPAAQGGEPPLKTYTIDLSQAPAQSAADVETAPQVVEEAAPPPEGSAPAAVEPEHDPVASATPPPETARPEPAAAPPPAEAAPAPTPPPVAAESSAVPSGKGWAVQLGFFSSQDNAAGLVKRMQAKGFDAFVMPVKSDKGTRYKVRIGPVADRAAATELLGKVKPSVKEATVVPHP